MFTIALVNQKGGVGKSTTAVSLSAGLARLGKRVLLVDLDPQAHATISLGLRIKPEASVYSVLTGTTRASEAVRSVRENLWLMPSTIDLAGGEAELASRPNPHFILRDAMAELGDSAYDFAIVDSPPQLGFLNLNSLAWVREVFIPVQCEFYALHGLSLLMQTVERVKATLNPALQISAVIACQFNPRRALTRDVLAELERHFPGRVLKTRIRVNVRLAEAPSHGMPIFDYAPESNGAVDYMNLAKEVIELPPPVAAPAAEPVVSEPRSGESNPPVVSEPAPPPAPTPMPDPFPEPIVEAPAPETVVQSPPTRQLTTFNGLRPIVEAKPKGSEPEEPKGKGFLAHRFFSIFMKK